MSNFNFEVEEIEYDENLANENIDVFEEPNEIEDGIGEDAEIDESEVEC